MAQLFTPVTFRSVTARNRIVVSPMCQYSAIDGLGNDWHIQHLGARAMGGAASCSPRRRMCRRSARITPDCLGLWNPRTRRCWRALAAMIDAWRRGAGDADRACRAQGQQPAPWEGGKALPVEQGGWVPVAPAPIAFGESPRRAAGTDRGRHRRDRRRSSPPPPGGRARPGSR